MPQLKKSKRPIKLPHAEYNFHNYDINTPPVFWDFPMREMHFDLSKYGLIISTKGRSLGVRRVRIQSETYEDKAYACIPQEKYGTELYDTFEEAFAHLKSDNHGAWYGYVGPVIGIDEPKRTKWQFFYERN